MHDEDYALTAAGKDAVGALGQQAFYEHRSRIGLLGSVILSRSCAQEELVVRRSFSAYREDGSQGTGIDSGPIYHRPLDQATSILCGS